MINYFQTEKCLYCGEKIVDHIACCQPKGIYIVDKTEWFENELKEIDKTWFGKWYKIWLAITEWYYGLKK